MNLSVCKDRDKYKEKLRETQKYVDFFKLECDRQSNKTIKSFFGAKICTHKALLEALFNLVKSKSSDHSFSFLDFLNMFSSDTSGERQEDKKKPGKNKCETTFNFKRQHVFESICRAMLVLNYDKNYWGEKKEFFTKLEDWNESIKPEDISTILDKDVNEGNQAGSVDIFFRIPKSAKPRYQYDKPPCNQNYSVDPPPKDDKDLYILIQNKYFTNEFSSEDKYDVNKILQRSLKLDKIPNAEKKLVLMINNKGDLVRRIKWTNVIPSSDIFGVVELNQWFMNMIKDMKKSATFDEFLKVDTSKQTSQYIQPRFHQRLFIEATQEHNRKANGNKKKFVWGAVPRSGKSFMIGGSISRRNTDTVIVVLGAKTETEEPFVKMFCQYEDFKDYGIITDKKRWSGDWVSSCKNLNVKRDKNIILLSQEKLKVNLSDKTKAQKERAVQQSEKFWDQFDKFMPKDKTVDIYFDEIHKGGSTETAEKYILSTLVERFTIGIFAMVTATYAKPTLAYSSIIDKENPIIIKWTYNDQQTMKQISDPFSQQLLIEERDDEIQKQVLRDLFRDFNLHYQDQYLTILENEYKKHPEMVLCKSDYDGLDGNIFKLACSAISTDEGDLRDPNKIFKNKGGVSKLIEHIGGYKEENERKDILHPGSIYGNLTYKLGYNVLNERHTELWFLPYSGLYDGGDNCADKLEIVGKISEERTGEEEEDKESKTAVSLPNIEPLTRGIVLLLQENPLFKEKYCFLIVHGQKLEYLGASSEIEGDCIYFSKKNKDSINKFIKDKEIQTFEKGKSLIVLTGSMLRLGISLPCADIAFNFDNVMSVDQNYQTMFRVLTERPGKNYGYYYDFNPNRPQQFLYEFNERYNKAAKSPEQSVNQLQSLLVMFNYNGLGVIKQDATAQLKLYSQLENQLGLNTKRYGEFIMKHGVKSVLVELAKNPISDDIKELIRREKLDIEKSFVAKKIKAAVKKGTKKKKHKLPPDEKEKPGDETDSDGESEDTEFTEKDIAVFINDYTSIIALFTDTYCPGENITLEECVNRVKEMSKHQLCGCDLKHINALGCYMERIKNYDKEKLNKSLDIFLKILETNPELRSKLDFIFTNIREDMGKKSMLITSMTPEKIQETITKYLPVREEEKDKYGEVFTPATLIEEMFDKLPKHVWSDPSLKWLDPANGIGNFPMLAYSRLMEGLKGKIPDREKRSECIIKEMLYMVELNEKNVAVSRKIFGPNANIFCGSFLTGDNKSVNPKVLEAFGIDKFDVIMGNPPFQKERDNTTGTTAGRSTLWEHFISLSFKILKENGFLGFINPPNWRGLGSAHYIWDLISNKQLLYIHIYNKKDGNKIFGVSSRFDLYIVQNKKNTKATEIIDELGKKHLIKVNEWPFLPNYDYNNINKILTSPENGIKVIHDSFYQASKFLKEKKTQQFNLPVIHTITKEGVGIRFAKENKGHFGIPKVILNFNEQQYSHPEQNDYKGNYGMSQISFGIPIKSEKEGEALLKAIQTPEFKEIIKATKWASFQTDWRMFTYFKPDFYKYFLDGRVKSKTTKRKLPVVPNSKGGKPKNKTLKKGRSWFKIFA